MAEPIRLSSVLADISRLYATLKEKRDKASVKEFRDRIIDLRKMLDDDILRTLGVPNSSDIDTWALLPDPLKLERLKRVDERVVLEESVELSDFFASVSNAVIEAQKNLNTFSEKYVVDVEANHPRIAPTYFAIPNIKAEMKIGFSELSEKGINVILFKDLEQTSRFAESTVTFELVSTPPTPVTPDEKPKPVSEDAPAPELGPPEALFLPEARLEGQAETEGLEVEGYDELRESLVEARASLYAATERLLEAKEGLAENLSIPIVGGKEREAILDQIYIELAGEGEAAEEMYVRTRDQAAVLKYRKENADRYLVLWPGKPEGSPEYSWQELRVYDLSGRGDEIRLDGTLFSRPSEESFLTITPRSRLLKLKKDQMADLILNLGDVHMSILYILNEWLEAAKRQP